MREKRGLKEGKKDSTYVIWKQRKGVLGVAMFKQGWEWEMEEKIEFMEKTNQRYV